MVFSFRDWVISQIYDIWKTNRNVLYFFICISRQILNLRGYMLILSSRAIEEPEEEKKISLAIWWEWCKTGEIVRHSLNKDLLRTYYVPSSVLSNDVAAVNLMTEITLLHELISCGNIQTINFERKYMTW